LATITPISEARPAPPDGLTTDQVDVWCDVVTRLPADWFPRETHALLAEYCRAVTRARFVGAAVDAFEAAWLNAEGGVERYAKLVATADRQVRLMTSLARALRITNQSRLKAETAVRRAGEIGADAPRPWLPEART
jgi:hypothetical protein